MAAAIANGVDGLGVEFVDPIPVTLQDVYRCHHPAMVDEVMTLKRENGFGTKSQSVADSLPYTNGAMYTAAKLAEPDRPTCALVSGFHHAGYADWKHLGWFCTFNGLVITAMKLADECGYGTPAWGSSRAPMTTIIDCDMHWGNGTDDILARPMGASAVCTNLSFGKHFKDQSYADRYLEWLEPRGYVYDYLVRNKPDFLLYQAGADVHVNDPYGGVLTTEQIMERDVRMFSIAKELGIPLAWNLAGGYQVDADGSIGKVLEIHLNTFRACSRVYGPGPLPRA